MAHPLDALLHPRHIAVVGACPNDPARMGTRTLYDLVQSGWTGSLWPVSSRHDTLYDLPVWRSLRDLPEAPDVVLARTPQAGIDALVDDAVAVGARFLVVLAAGFAETGESGLAAQQALVTRARQGGLRIVGPQSIGLVHASLALPMSLSQIMERFDMQPGTVALLAQSGAMAIALAIRGQQQVGLDFSLVATFGNAADVNPVEMLDWLADDPCTRVAGLYLEGLTDADAFAHAVTRCRRAGKPVVVLRAGLSRRGAVAVASHTASMSGDGEAFRALCRQLGVVVCDAAEDFLWALKALAAPGAQASGGMAFASISGGACALWADHCEQLGLQLPTLDAAQTVHLAQRLPAFLTPANPLDLGPAVFDDAAFEGALQGLLAHPGIDRLVVYLFTSSPTLMGGLTKLRLLEDLARRASHPVWVIWEAATDVEWQALARSPVLCGFRDLAQAAQALKACQLAQPGLGFEPASAHGHARPSAPLNTEIAVKEWLRGHGLLVPSGRLCMTEAEARATAAAAEPGQRLVVKIVSPLLPHKSDVGGVAFCNTDPDDVARARLQVLDAAGRHRPDVQPLGVLVEHAVEEPGLEMILTVRRDPALGLITVIGRGGLAVEVDRDVVMHVGRLDEARLPGLLDGLRCAPLIRGHRGKPPLAVHALGVMVSQLQAALTSAGVNELELNPVLLTPQRAWVLDALAS